MVSFFKYLEDASGICGMGWKMSEVSESTFNLPILATPASYLSHWNILVPGIEYLGY
jgi:hypothetical protein